MRYLSWLIALPLLQYALFSSLSQAAAPTSPVAAPVAAASGNRALAKMVVTLHHQTARYWLYAMRGPTSEESYTALNEHRALAEAIAGHDAARARTEMLKVLGDFPAEMKRTLEGR